MVQRLEAVTPRPKKDGTNFWLRVGTAWPAKKGEGYDLTLDAYPAPDKEGRIFIALRVPKDDGRQQTSAPNPMDDLDDDINF